MRATRHEEPGLRRRDRFPHLGILRELAFSGLITLADKGCTGAGDHIRTR